MPARDRSVHRCSIGAGVGRSVYVSVASEVAACEENWLPFAKDAFSAYFDGKRSAEEAAADAVGGDATKFCVVKPTFIYGGEVFALKPPRVTAAYGSGVEEVLSLAPIQALADAAALEEAAFARAAGGPEPAAAATSDTPGLFAEPAR